MKNLRLQTLLTLLAVNLLVAGGAAFVLYQSRAASEERALATSLNLAIGLDQSLSGSVRVIDLALAQAVADLEQALREHGRLDVAAAREVVAQHQALLFTGAQIRATDAAGNVVLGADVAPESGASWGDRDFFQRLRADPQAGLTVSDPIFGRVSQRWVISFARRYNLPDGSFAGAISIAVDVDYFHNQLAALDVGPHGVALLRDSQLRLITRHPAIDTPAGRIGAMGFSPELSEAISSGRQTASFHSRRTADGIERTSTYRRLGAVPFHLVVGLGADDYLTRWRNDAIGIIAGYLIFLVTTLLGTRSLLRAQSRARREALRSLALLDNSGDGIHILDAAGRVIQASDSFCRMLGYTPQEVIGMRVPDWDPVRDPAELRETLPRLLREGGQWMFETLHRRKDGSIFPAEVAGQVVEIEGERIFFNASRDISARKAAEAELARHREHLEELVAARTAELQASETRFRSLVDQSLAGIDIIQDGRFRYVNQAFATMFGYASPAEIIDCLPVESVVAPECRELVANTIRDRTAGVVDSSHYRFTGMKRDGSRVEVEIFGRRIDFGGRAASIGIVVDVTERLAMEREREAVLRDLAQAKEAAEAATVAKSAFLANMSHEIRTPLNAIMGMAHLVRRGGLTPRQDEQMSHLLGACGHLLDVINAVLDLSKIEAGKLQLDAVPVRLDAMAEGVLALLRERAERKGLALRSEVAPIAAPLLGDATRLQQALVNYMANAVKFTERGGVTLRIAPEGEDAQGVLIRFEVEDTGIGIEQGALARLFTAFEQADNSLTRKYGGTGLGLAITREIALMMGGEAGARSTPGEGSTFWFTARLRRGEAGAEAAVVPAHATEAALRALATGRRVLAVDDEALNLEIEKMLLEEVGFTVDAAEDGEAAVACAARQDYALILMDMQMPVQDGLAATRRIRAGARNAATPILATTANAFAEDRARCLDAGMNDYLVKPIDPATLYAKLLRWLSPGGSPAVAGLDWSMRYLVGIEPLDTQHRALLALCREVALLLESGGPPDDERLHQLLEEIRHHAQQHFADEERLLEQHGYPDMAAQRADHSRYLEAIARLLLDASFGRLTPAAVQAQLGPWWLAHILESDMLWKDYMAQRLAPTV